MNDRLQAIYDLPGSAPTGDRLDGRLRRWLRRTYLRSPADLNRVRRYASEHAPGVRVTLAGAVHDPVAAALIGPEVLLILERLQADPLRLREDWPLDVAVEPLLALAGVNARPYQK
jgi:hypothetical protein